MGRVALAAVSVLTLSCRGPYPRVDAPRVASALPSAIDPQSAGATMASLRGVAYGTPVGVHVLDSAALVERRHAYDPVQRFVGVLPKKFWAAFHFAPDEPTAWQAQRAAADAAVAGFYDPGTDELFVRAGRPSASERLILAHEIAHAVQRRLGAIPWPPKDPDEDIARSALVEGDASLMAAAYVALDAHRAIGVSVARIRDRLEDMSDAARARAYQLPEGVVGAPPLVRARLFFPYVEGTAFATTLYQSGGLALLNAALLHPPVSTEQVLHPQKYVAGELPIPVSPPPASDGAIVDHGTVGELQTGVYLAQCMSERRARRAAEGWGGDAYTVVLDDRGNPATLWSTVWDSEDAAIRFEAALHERDHCEAAGRAPRFARRGARVAVVDAPEDARYRPEDLFELVQPTPARAPPVGDVVLRVIPPPEPTFLHQGHVVGETFASESIGVAATVPSDVVAEAPPEGVELGLHARARVGGLFFMFEPVTAELEEAMVHEMVVGARRPKAKIGGCENRKDEYVTRLPAGLADIEDVTTWDCKHLVAAFVPACDGEASVVLFGASEGSGESPIDDWFATVRVAGGSPACAYLRALAAPQGTGSR